MVNCTPQAARMAPCVYGKQMSAKIMGCGNAYKETMGNRIVNKNSVAMVPGSNDYQVLFFVGYFGEIICVILLCQHINYIIGTGTIFINGFQIFLDDKNVKYFVTI
jgi:hypothetical protein